MSRIRNLELLFNLEKKNIKSATDCVVAAIHCLLINEGLNCVGTGDKWPKSDSQTITEMLPKEWNINQELYYLRYINKGGESLVLMKISKASHMLHVNAVVNEEDIASMMFPVANYISDNFKEYSTAYKDLGSFTECFHKDIMVKLSVKLKTSANDKAVNTVVFMGGPSTPSSPKRPQPNLRKSNTVPGPFPKLDKRSPVPRKDPGSPAADVD